MNKKITIGVIVGLVIFIWSIYSTSSNRAHKLLSSYLKEKYGEEFVIEYFGKRKVRNREWYEAGIVYPKSYIGTEKENDTYYWGRGFVEIKGMTLDPGDSYGGVLLNESANEFYLPKLKELFGANVLPVLNIDGKYEYTDFRKEYLRIEKVISGGIYIFGKVENDEDREWYRKQIYEFVQFMKQTGTFEYVDLRVVISDEKVLSYQFQNDNELKDKIIKLRLNSKNDKLFFKQRTELMKKIDINKVTKEEQQEILNSINKGNLIDGGFADFVAGNSIFYKKLYSPKYIESQNLDEELKVEYNNLDEMKFTWEMY